MDFNKIISDSKISLLRYVITILSSFLLIPIITRYVGEAEYGIWMTILSVIGIFSAVGGGHMHGALIRYASTEEREGQTFVDTGIVLLILASLSTFVFLALSVVTDVLPYQDIAPNRWSAIIAIAFLIVTTITSHFMKNYPRSQGRVKQYELLEILTESGYLILLPAAFLITESVLIAVWALVGLYGLVTISLLGYYYPTWIQIPNTSNFRRNLRYALPMIPKQLSSRIFAQADRYLILLFISPTAVAVYTVSDQIVNIFRTLTGIMGSTLYPSVSQAWENGEINDLKQLYSNVLRGYIILAVPAFAGLTILARPALELLSTPNIAAEGAIFIPLLGIGYLIWGAESPVAYILSATEQTEKIAGITVVVAIGNIILNIILLPAIGLIGAVIATVIMQCLKTTYMFFVARRSVPFALPITTIGKAVVATIIMSSTLLIIPAEGDILSIMVYPPVGIAVYAATMVLLGGINIQEVRSVISRENS